MRLGLLVSLLASVAALAACSSTGEAADVALQSQATDPSDPTKDGGANGEPSTTDEDTDAGSPSDEDAGSSQPTKPAKDGGADGTAPADAAPTGPAAFTKAEVQMLFDDKCAPCHIDFASGGMSLANDFTAKTVDVASMQVPSLKRIKKGDPKNSYLFHKVAGTHTTVGGTGARMPKGGTPLTSTELERLAKYIDGL